MIIFDSPRNPKARVIRLDSAESTRYFIRGTMKTCIFCTRKTVKNSVFCRRHRKINRNKAKSREALLRRKKLCVRCGLVRLRKRTTCIKCVKLWSDWAKKKAAERLKKGLCPRCGRKLRIGKTKSRCLRCQKQRRAIDRECGFFYRRAKYFLASHYKCTKIKATELAKILENKWKTQRGLCVLSGRKLRKSNLSQIDHIRPFSAGGTSSPRNLRWVHRDVNQAKRALSDAIFIRLCQEVAGFNR